jgi:hypothetical protein
MSTHSTSKCFGSRFSYAEIRTEASKKQSFLFQSYPPRRILNSRCKSSSLIGESSERSISATSFISLRPRRVRLFSGGIGFRAVLLTSHILGIFRPIFCIRVLSTSSNLILSQLVGLGKHKTNYLQFRRVYLENTKNCIAAWTAPITKPKNAPNSSMVRRCSLAMDMTSASSFSGG